MQQHNPTMMLSRMERIMPTSCQTRNPENASFSSHCSTASSTQSPILVEISFDEQGDIDEVLERGKVFGNVVSSIPLKSEFRRFQVNFQLSSDLNVPSNIFEISYPNCNRIVYDLEIRNL